MFGSVVNLSPPRRFYASSTFLSFLGFPPSCSLTAYLSQCYAVRQQITLGDLCWFWLHPVQIGHLWEFQPSQSHRETDLSGEYLLFKPAVSGATLNRTEDFQCVTLYSWGAHLIVTKFLVLNTYSQHRYVRFVFVLSSETQNCGHTPGIYPARLIHHC